MSQIENVKTDIAENEEKVKERYLDFYFSDFWRGFVKFWWIGVVAALLFGGAMFYRSYKSYVPQYTATATFTVHTQNAVLSGDAGLSAYSFYYDRGSASQLASVFPYVLKSEILQKQVCQELGVDSMPATVSVTCVDETNMITLTTTGRDPQLTYDTLICVTENYSKVSEYIVGQTKLVMISPAVVPTSPSNSFSWRGDTLKGALVGLLLGIAWIVLYGLLRRTIRTKDDIRRELNQKCIGVIPQVFFKRYRSKIDKRILITNPLIGNSFLESIRLLRDAVQNSLGAGDKAIMVTSTAPGEGKSVATLNLAAIFAKNETRVLVMDCDLRSSGVKKLVKPADIEEKHAEYDENGEIMYTINRVDGLNIDLLLFNTKEKSLSKIVRTSNLQNIIDSFYEKYDLIFIDTPPCGMISDAAIVAGAADAALYVIKQDTVMDSGIQQGLDTLSDTDIKLLGCILNGTIGGIGGYGSSYGYGYGYGGYKKYYRYGKYYGKYGYGRYGYGNSRKSEKEVQK
ncbi:MAG: AAA family ATPase [Clostridia bacterium]|nr:AAA family ATPase [Clostridia bacterium]